MLTATKLGGKVGVSNREINRRLVDAGLAVRLPCGEYILTEQGKLMGESGDYPKFCVNLLRGVE